MDLPLPVGDMRRDARGGIGIGPAAAGADGGADHIVLHYHDPNDPTRPPIDLNDIVDDLELLANAPHPCDDDDDGTDDDYAVSIDDEAEESDLTSSASSDGGDGDKNDSNTSGSSNSNDDGGSGDWRPMIV